MLVHRINAEKNGINKVTTGSFFFSLFEKNSGEKKNSLFFPISLAKAQKKPRIQNNLFKNMGEKIERNPILVLICCCFHMVEIVMYLVVILFYSRHRFCDACTRSKHLTTAYRLGNITPTKRNRETRKKKHERKKEMECCIRWECSIWKVKRTRRKISSK